MKNFVIVFLSLLLATQISIAEDNIKTVEITLEIVSEESESQTLKEAEYVNFSEDENNVTTDQDIDEDKKSNELDIADLHLYQDTAINYNSFNLLDRDFTIIGAVLPIGSVFYLKKKF